MRAKSWNDFIEIVAYDKEGNTMEISALYIVAVPADDKLEKDVGFQCYRPTYIPRELVKQIGKAYGVALEFDIEDFEKYKIKGYRPDIDLYVFNEGLSYDEGLEQVFKILETQLKSEGFEPVRMERIT